MIQMKTTWPPKLDAKIQFCCFSFIALVFGLLDICEPETVSVKGLLLQAVFWVGACFYGYQIFFHSENWFRAKQEKDARDAIQWRAKHPVLHYLLSLVLPFLVVGFFIAKDYWSHLHKN
jgi:hypothetical protein